MAELAVVRWLCLQMIVLARMCNNWQPLPVTRSAHVVCGGAADMQPLGMW